MIAFVDSQASGHHLSYQSRMMDEATKAGYRVIGISPDPQELSNRLRQYTPAGGNADLVREWPSIPEKGGTSRIAVRFRTFRRWQHLSRLINNYNRTGTDPIKAVFFPFLESFLADGFTSLLSMRQFRYPFAGLIFTPRNLFDDPVTFPRSFFKQNYVLALSQCKCVAVLDEVFQDRVAQSLSRPCILFPDFADTTAPDLSWPLAASIPTLAKGRVVVTLLGSLDARKGTFEFLRFAAIADPTKFYFVAVGSLRRNSYSQYELNTILKSTKPPQENLLFHFEEIPTEGAFNALVQNSDLLYVCYRDFSQSSNLLTKAAAFKVPVVAHSEHLIGERVQRYNLGWASTTKKRDSMIAGLTKHKVTQFRNGIGFTEGALAYATKHDVKQLRPSLSTVMRLLK